MLISSGFIIATRIFQSSLRDSTPPVRNSALKRRALEIGHFGQGRCRQPNPEGIQALSPGLRVSATLGSDWFRISNPERVASTRTECSNPFQGCRSQMNKRPRVALARNPGLSDGIPLGFRWTRPLQNSPAGAASYKCPISRTRR